MFGKITGEILPDRVEASWIRFLGSFVFATFVSPLPKAASKKATSMLLKVIVHILVVIIIVLFRMGDNNVSRAISGRSYVGCYMTSSLVVVVFIGVLVS